MEHIGQVSQQLREQFAALKQKRDILKAPELKQLYAAIRTIDPGMRADYGQAVNALRQELTAMVEQAEVAVHAKTRPPIDVTAPFDSNVVPDKRPRLLPTQSGTIHPLSSELDRVSDIFTRMGFEMTESRQIDNDYNMFEALNFPPDHPARDDYDTFTTEEGLIAPAHTSTMQHRVLRAGEPPVRKVIFGRVFRNEDLDAKHEHTLHQIEGVYVDKGITVGNLLATLQAFLSEYYQQDIVFRTQPSYFPFVEPGLEFSLQCPFCHGTGCKTCGHEGWIELIGCGMIHPHVLREAGLDPKVYTGFAWGFGLDRLIMMKHGIEDIRHFNAGSLHFLRQFTS